MSQFYKGPVPVEAPELLGSRCAHHGGEGVESVEPGEPTGSPPLVVAPQPVVPAPLWDENIYFSTEIKGTNVTVNFFTIRCYC